MQLKKAIAMISIVSLLGCYNTPDIIKGEPPFINNKCNYKDFSSLKFASEASAADHGLKAEFNSVDTEGGVFSILLWKKDFNIIVAGIPRHRQAYFTAIKRGAVSQDDWQIAQSISERLPLTCSPATGN